MQQAWERITLIFLTVRGGLEQKLQAVEWDKGGKSEQSLHHQLVLLAFINIPPALSRCWFLGSEDKKLIWMRSPPCWNSWHTGGGKEPQLLTKQECVDIATLRKCRGSTQYMWTSCKTELACCIWQPVIRCSRNPPRRVGSYGKPHSEGRFTRKGVTRLVLLRSLSHGS